MNVNRTIHGIALAALLTTASAAQAVVFTNVQIASDADLLNSGALVSANNLGNSGSPAAAVVNGVSFGTDQSGLAGFPPSGSDFCVSPVCGGFSADMQTLLEGLAYGPIPNTTSTLTLTGLVAGDTYRLQMLFWNELNTTGDTTNLTIDSVNHTFTRASGTASIVRAEFTALAAATSVTFHNGGGESTRQILNAYALHAVPEPATLVLLGLGLVGVGLGKRSRRG